MQAKKAARAKIGDRIGKRATAKRFTNNDFANLPYNSRTLHAVNCLILPKQGTSDEINLRDRDIASIGGIKVFMELLNNTSEPMLLNMAMVTAKEKDFVNEVDFFRGTGPTRGIDFADALTSLDFSTRSINSDKYFVHWHTKRVLGPQLKLGATSLTPDYGLTTFPSCYQTMSRYTLLKRQLTFDGATSFPSNGNMHLIWWWDGIMKPAGSLASGGLKMSMRHVLYFREPK